MSHITLKYTGFFNKAKKFKLLVYKENHFQIITRLNALFYFRLTYLPNVRILPKRSNIIVFILLKRVRTLNYFIATCFNIVCNMNQEMTTTGARRKNNNFLILFLYINIRYPLFNHFFLV